MSGMGDAFMKTVLSMNTATRGSRKTPRGLILYRSWAMRNNKVTVQAKNANDSRSPMNGKNDFSIPR